MVSDRGSIPGRSRMCSDLAFATIAELGRMLRAGETSSVDLTRQALARLDLHGRALNAVVTLTEERALREAAAADHELLNGVDRGPLHGIPYGAKDLLAASGYATTWGAAPYRDRMIDRDAGVVSRLREAGAVLVAKLAMVELAGGFGYEQPNAALTGPGRSAWNPDRWAGGSSSGSGSAVAAGLVPFAIGTETWGSIHCPSAFNGVTGLRPTIGRVSREGAMALSWTMDKIGPMARSAADSATVLAAIAGPSTADSMTLGQPPLDGDERTGGFRRSRDGWPLCRIGLLKGSLDGCAAGVAANARAALDALSAIGTIEEVELPDLPWDEAASIIIMCEAVSAFEPFLESGAGLELTAPEDRTGLYHALAVPAVDYLKALRIRTEGARAMTALLGDYDALIAPTYPVPPPPAEGNFTEFFDKHPAAGLSAMGNLIGLPSIAVPTGLDEDGLPSSLEILGAWWAEPTVVAIATAYQQRTTWHQTRPGGF
jgi:aspartyl-tRNA(Asn)/glutamyl-tRNA(Gln) amidotransferase subunit A